MKNYQIKSVLALVLFIFVQAQSIAQTTNQSNKKWFVGYETLEMSMNKFQYFAGEAGYKVDSKNQFRMMLGEVKLTEAHLANKWQSAAVEGPDVEGYFRIYELYYDRFFGKRNHWYYGGNVGYTNDQYHHLKLPYRINNHTPTVGFQIGYQHLNLFKVKHLYINFSMPFRYYFNPIHKQKWGETTIQVHKFVNNIWFFIGYNF